MKIPHDDPAEVSGFLSSAPYGKPGSWPVSHLFVDANLCEERRSAKFKALRMHHLVMLI